MRNVRCGFHRTAPVLFSQIQLVPECWGLAGLHHRRPHRRGIDRQRRASGSKVYTITDARVVYAVGEGKHSGPTTEGRRDHPGRSLRLRQRR